MVGRIAKIKGAASVVGIAGSDDKCAWMVNEAGFDHAINDKTQDVADELSRLVPSGIDLFWDNVGGPILDACLGQLATWATQGRITAPVHMVDGLAHAPVALNLLFTGGNTGKVIVRLEGRLTSRPTADPDLAVVAAA